jgi:outer membrane autotransporter protein
MENRKTIGSWSNKSRAHRWRRLLIARWAWLAAGCLFTMAAHALDATWRTDAPTNDWNSSTNWQPSGPPDGIAAFGESITTAITFTSIPTTIVGTLQFNSAQAYTFDLANNLNINQGGVLPNNAAPSFTTHSGKFLQFDNSATAGNSVINVSTGGTADFEKLTTAATAVITSAGTTEFFNSASAANAIITTNSGGVVQFAGTSTGGSATFITNTGGTFDISGLTSAGMTAGSIAGGGAYNLGSVALTVGNSTNTQVSGVIADGGIFDPTATGSSLIKVGTGTLTLSGANTYSGGTTVAGGVLSVATNANLGNAAGGIALQGGELLTTDNAFSSARTVALSTTGSALAAATGTTAIYTGIVSGTGGLTIGDGVNTGTVFLASGGANNYTGGTTILGRATLQVTGNGDLGNASGGITLTGGTLATQTFTTGRVVTLIGQGTLAASPNTLFNATATYNGQITGPGALTVGDANSSTLTVALTNPTNDYAGGTTITGGAQLQVNADSELGGGPITLNGGALHTTTVAPSVFATTRTVNLESNLLFDNVLVADTTATYNGVIVGPGSLTIGGGTVVLTNTNTYAGGTKVGFAVLSISNDANLGLAGTEITLNGGTLLATGGGVSSPRPIQLIASEGPNALAASDGTIATYSGLVFGAGPLQIGINGIEATGTVALSGTNSYTGGTLVTAGATLSVNADGALGDPSGAITLSGGELQTTADFITARTIALNPLGLFTNRLAATGGTSAIYQGVISGTGGLQIGDGRAGTVVFQANNTYLGDTTVIVNSVLSIDKDAELGNINNGIRLRFGGELLTTANFTTTRTVSLNPPFAPNIGVVIPLGQSLVNTLAAADGTTGTYAGQIFGTGGLDIGEASGNHAGAVVLANPTNSYTGGTLVQGSATLSVASDTMLGNAGGGLTLQGGELLTTGNGFSTARSVALVLSGGRNNTLAAETGTTATYSSVLTGNGGLVVGDSTHAGTILLKGSNTYSGGTVIDLGTLLVDNPQALGTGDVIVNGGVLAADPQPINVLGNYTQNSGGTLQLNIAGRASGQFDVLKVTGNAALDGSLRLLNQGYQPASGDKLKLITTGGVVNGRFSQLENPFALAVGFDTIDLVYARQSVSLEFLKLHPPVPPGPPGTPGAPEVIMTTDFSSFAFTPNQHAAAHLLDAVQLDPRATNLMTFLNAEPFANLPTDFRKISPEGLTSFYEITFSNANIQRLNLEDRLDDIHHGSNGFSSNMKVNGGTVNLDSAGPDGKSSKAVVEPVLQHDRENRWGVWMTGFGDFVSVDADANAQGYNFTTGGVTLGLDFRITDQLAVGIMGDYSHTWTSVNPAGHMDVNSGRGGVYATWYNHGLYFNGAIYGGHNNYDSSRSGLVGLATGGTEGAEWSTFVSGGYDFHFGALTVGPVAALQYTSVGIDGFSEQGSVAPLEIHSDSAQSLRSDIGFRVFYQWQIGKILVTPSLKAAWEHEYKYSALPITAGFAGIPGPSATFFGPNEGHDSAIINAGVSVQLTPSIVTYLNYAGQLGRENYDSNAVTGGIRINF